MPILRRKGSFYFRIFAVCENLFLATLNVGRSGGKTAQKLRALVAFAEDRAWISRTHMAAHNNPITPILGNLIPSFGLLRY